MWYDIKGFGNRYEISDEFVIKRKSFSHIQRSKNNTYYTRTYKEKTIEPFIDNEGYWAVALDGSPVRLHWIIYNTFVGDSTGFVVDHIDRNRLNNNISNLRLVKQNLNQKNRTLAYKPDITDISKYQTYRNKETAKPYRLRFSENGVRKTIGYYATYEEAENKYRELYEERQKRIDNEYITGN